MASHGDVSRFPIDVVIPALAKDFSTLGACIASVREFVPGVRRVLVISPDPPPPELVCDTATPDKLGGGGGGEVSRVTWVDERRLVGLDKAKVAALLGAAHRGSSGGGATAVEASNPRVGWYVQQVLKLRVFELLAPWGVGDRVLVLDADAAFHRETPMVHYGRRRKHAGVVSAGDVPAAVPGSASGGVPAAADDSAPTATRATPSADAAGAFPSDEQDITGSGSGGGGGGDERWDDGATLYGALPGYRHGEYFAHVARVTRGRVVAQRAGLSGICHHMLLERATLAGLEKLVEAAWASTAAAASAAAPIPAAAAAGQAVEGGAEMAAVVAAAAESKGASTSSGGVGSSGGASSGGGGVALWERFLMEVDPAQVEAGGASEFELLFNYALQHRPRSSRVRLLDWRNNLGQVTRRGRGLVGWGTLRAIEGLEVAALTRALACTSRGCARVAGRRHEQR